MENRPSWVSQDSRPGRRILAEQQPERVPQHRTARTPTGAPERLSVRRHQYEHSHARPNRPPGPGPMPPDAAVMIRTN